MLHVLFDIGGTTTRLAVTTDTCSLVNVLTFPTPVKPDAFIKKFAAYVAEYKKITMVVGGMRGILTEDKTRLQHDTVLSDWQHYPLADELHEITKAKVIMENDSALAGLGEAVHGAGQGAEVIAYHDISTGVGGAKIVGGAIEIGSTSIEPGHQVLDIDRTILGEDVSPTLENLISGRAIEARLGMKATDILPDDVIWDELAGYLAQGLRNSILYWSPEIIVLGGSMMTGFPRIPLDTVRRETVAVLDSVAPCPFITLGTLGDHAGLYGAMVRSR